MYVPAGKLAMFGLIAAVMLLALHACEGSFDTKKRNGWLGGLQVVAGEDVFVQ